MERVEEMLRPSLKTVVISSREGNMENSSDSFIYIVVIRIYTDSAILTANNRSRSAVGRGMIIKNIATMTNTVTTFFPTTFLRKFRVFTT